ARGGDRRGRCRKTSPFVAGESAGAFWTLAPATLAPPQWRPFAYAAAVTFGVAVSALRIAFGGHFFTDTVFAGVLMFLIVWVVHGLIYRWRPTRLSDAGVERALECVTGRIWRAAAALVARRNKRSGEV